MRRKKPEASAYAFNAAIDECTRARHALDGAIARTASFDAVALICRRLVAADDRFRALTVEVAA